MAQGRLQHVLRDFRKTLTECRAFATDANTWATPGAHPHISRKRRDSIYELVFLRTFLAWETFLEESFVLYLVGQTAPKGRPPTRFTFPPTRKTAEEWLVPEGRPYAVWDGNQVIGRAERYFRDGRPFAAVLRANQSVLAETKTIRNAIAHESKSAQEKFEGVVRTKLGSLPTNLTVGSFLNMTIPASSPPQSFLEFYLEKIELVSQRIIPSS